MEQDKLREAFAHYLKGSGFSIAEVSKAIGISARTIYNWRAAGQQLCEEKTQRLKRHIGVV